jgi:hypothetical protein
MTKILEDVIERLRKMPEERQESLARLMLHEMEEDDRWTSSTHQSANKLQKLVDEVVDADLRGECEPLDPEKL